MSVTHKEIMALHRYFLWADRMRVHFHQMLQAGESKPEEAMMHPYMSYWYSGTCALIEGWRELKLSDPQIDGLLQSPHVTLLKRYRNGAFHFQSEYFDTRFLGFIAGEGSAEWISQLREAFSRWFWSISRGRNPRDGRP